MNSSDDRSIARVIEDIAGGVQEIIRSEIRLAKIEIEEEATKASRAGSALGAGAVLGLYALGFFLMTIMFALALAMSLWIAALIVAVVTGIASAALISAGRERLKRVRPVPPRTVETLKENAV